MQNYVKKFSVEDVKMYREQKEDMDFSVVEIWALAEGTNSHRNPFSKMVLERDAETFKGKFVVAKYNKFKNDVEGHETDEILVGYVDPREEVEFKTKFVEKEGIEKEFVVVKALLSKIYAREIVDMFRLDNERTVSCEFSCSTEYEENEYGRPIDEFGVELNVENPILSYHIHAITILGKDYNPSVMGTEIKVKQFAEKCNKLSLKDFAIKRLKEFSKENLLDNDNYDNNIKDKEDNMEEEKKLSESKEDKDIVMEEEKEMTENIELSETEDKEMSEDTDKEMSEEEEKEMSEEPKEMSEDTDKEMGCDKEMSDSEEKEMSEEEKEDEEKEMEEKKFSLDAYLDQAVILTMLENETESCRELVNHMTKEMSANEIVESFIKMSKENDSLKAEKQLAEREKAEKKFSAIMASVKEDLDEKVFTELSEEGKELSLDQLGAFENKVKAFAYDASRNKVVVKAEDDGIMKFSASDDTNNNTESLDVFDRLSQM